MNVRRIIRKALQYTLLTSAFAVMALGSSALFAPASAHADSMNWDAVAQCESGGNWSANTGNGFYGGLQFKPATWASHGGVGSPAMATREQQIQVAERVYAKQGPGAWPTCGSSGGAPAMWDLPAAPSAGGTGCGAIRPGGIFGIIDLRQICSTFLAPLTALGQPR